MGVKSARLRPDSASIFARLSNPLRPSRMPKSTSFLRVFTETGPLVALAVAIALLVGIAGPASAQFFNFGGFGGPPQRQAPQRGGGWFGGDFFTPFQQQQPSQQAPRQDFSRAPGPAKRDTAAERNVLVLGDAMADWLGYGLEDAYSEQPDMGVIRKHKTDIRPDQVSAARASLPIGPPPPGAFSPPRSLTPSSSCSASTIARRSARRPPRRRPTRKTTRRTRAPSPTPRRIPRRTPNRRTRRSRSRKVRRGQDRRCQDRRRKAERNPAMPNWTTPPTMMRRPPQRPKRARAHERRSL